MRQFTEITVFVQRYSLINWKRRHVILCRFTLSVSDDMTLHKLNVTLSLEKYSNKSCLPNLGLPDQIIVIKGTSVLHKTFHVHHVYCNFILNIRLHLSDYRKFWNTKIWKSFD